MSRKKGAICPSTPGRSGDILFASMNCNGRLNYMKQGVEVDSQLSRSLLNSSDGSYYRFYAECVSKKCGNWSKNKCALPSRIDSHSPRKPDKNNSYCVIRDKCRWFMQEKFEACDKCQFILYTGISETLSHSS